MKWQIGIKGDYGTYNACQIYNESENGVAYVYGIAQNRMLEDLEESDMEGLRNARLIAAAPELLDALIEVVRISDRNHVAWDAAHKAIAKARGES